jgi:hypothetical protein
LGFLRLRCTECIYKVLTVLGEGGVGLEFIRFVVIGERRGAFLLVECRALLSTDPSSNDAVSVIEVLVRH